MCGIFCAIGPNEQTAEQAQYADHANQQQAYRGPDAAGVHVIHMGSISITLAMTRLRITDQSDIPVPYRYPQWGITLAYNGEIYNWKEIRAELDNPWETNCDAEVLAAAWFHEGPKCLDRLNGMWSFILVDENTQSVWACRDRAGEKPLYLAREPNNPDTTYFASEIKGLPIALTEQPCLDVEIFDFDCRSELPIANVTAVEPATLLHVDLIANTTTSRKWWSLPHEADQEQVCTLPKYTETIDELRHLISNAIKIRVPEQVQYGILLSGGLDSAIIQAIAKSDHLYCLTFPDYDTLNVSDMAYLAAKGSPVQEVTFSRQDLIDILPTVAYHLDTPATWTAICQWHTFKRAASDKCQVVISGEGADELFLGYTRYRILWRLSQIFTDPLLVDYQPLAYYYLQRSADDILAGALNRADIGNREAYYGVKKIVQEYGAHATDADLATRMSRIDWATTMQVLLRMADRMASAHSIENRSPFLDHRVIELATSLPLSWKIAQQSNKTILRDVAYRFGVHPRVVHEQTKRGFTIPWPQWRSDPGTAQLARKTRGVWDRSDYAEMSLKAWRDNCLRGPAPKQ